MNWMRVALCMVLAAGASHVSSAQSDLDAFMQEVLARRDDNWKKLQQYVLDERETMELRGPARLTLWGEQRDYTWYIRDGFFIRSPLKVNGSAVNEDDRRQYEGQFLRHEIEREKRASGGGADSRGPAVSAPSPDEVPRDVDGLIAQTRQPQFVSSAYFLRFKFDQGRYALVGRERLEDRDVLRIEYYPTKLFQPDADRDESRRRNRESRNEDRNRDGKGDPPSKDRSVELANAQALTQLMNKTSKVTLWIEPSSHQIMKYTFDDLGWDFFPGAWLVRVSDVTASMTMGQMFPDVWLPRALEMDIEMMMAVGPVAMRYTLDYHDYRQADITSKIGIPGGR